MKEVYENLDFDVIQFEGADVIVTSGDEVPQQEP